MAPGSAAMRVSSLAALLLAALLLAALLLAGAGCTPQSSADPLAGAPAPVDPTLLRAEFDPLIGAHNERVAGIPTLEARGILEVRYRDEDGRHFEQADAELALVRGNCGALRLSKLGHNLFWIGGDGTRAWVFDLDSSPETATVYQGLGASIDAGDGQALTSGELSLLSPASVRFLMGLDPVPADAAARPLARDASELSDGAKGIRATHEVFWTRGPIGFAVRFGGAGHPAEIVVRDAAGEPLVRARLSNYEGAKVDGLSKLAWPVVATRVSVEAPQSGASALLALNEPSVDVRRVKPRFFVLDELVKHFQPETVRHVTPYPAQTPVGAAGQPRDPGSP